MSRTSDASDRYLKAIVAGSQAVYGVFYTAIASAQSNTAAGRALSSSQADKRVSRMSPKVYFTRSVYEDGRKCYSDKRKAAFQEAGFAKCSEKRFHGSEGSHRRERQQDVISRHMPQRACR